MSENLIKEYRTKIAHLTQKQLAEKLTIAGCYNWNYKGKQPICQYDISRYERGRSIPNDDIIKYISRQLNIKFDEVYNSILSTINKKFS